MKRILVVILMCGVLSSFSQINELERLGRQRDIKRGLKVVGGIILCGVFQVPAIPVMVAVVISEIVSEPKVEFIKRKKETYERIK